MAVLFRNENKVADLKSCEQIPIVMSPIHVHGYSCWNNAGYEKNLKNVIIVHVQQLKSCPGKDIVMPKKDVPAQIMYALMFILKKNIVLR